MSTLFQVLTVFMRVYVGYKKSLCAKRMTSSDVTKIIQREDASHPICLLQMKKKKISDRYGS